MEEPDELGMFVPPRYQLHRSSWKDLEWLATRLFSLYIRTKDADAYGYSRCITCGRKRHYTELHCGHYASRRNMCTKFMEINNHPQCPACNVGHGGRYKKMGIEINKRYGRGTASYIEELARKTCKFTKGDLIDLIVTTEKLIDNG